MESYLSHVEIDNDLFGKVDYIDIEQQYGIVPQAIVFNINNSDEEADYAVIRGSLRGSSVVDDWTLRIGEIHKLDFSRIYAASNARGIKILS